MRSLRDFANRTSAEIDARRGARRRFRSRTLLIADHWDGSVQQFYHFMLGYFMPLCRWLDQHKSQPIAVRDCGPMNVWFEALWPRVDIEILPPGSALHMVVGRRMRHVVLRGLDDPRKFHAGRLLEGAMAVRSVLELPVTNRGGNSQGVLIIDRASSEDFYHQAESETHMSGKERRSVPNLAQLPEELSVVVPVVVRDLARMDPRGQLALVSGSNVLVGQHGAGLAHMLWLEIPGGVVEIAPPLPGQVEHLFEHLAGVLDLKYRRVAQADVHSPVDLELVVRAVTELL